MKCEPTNFQINNTVLTKLPDATVAAWGANFTSYVRSLQAQLTPVRII